MKSLKDKFKDRKEQMKIHLEEFGKGKNRDIDGREKFIMTMILPVIEKEVAESVKELKNNLKANWHSYKNNRLGGVLTEIESSLGEFNDPEDRQSEQGDKNG